MNPRDTPPVNGEFALQRPHSRIELFWSGKDPFTGTRVQRRLRALGGCLAAAGLTALCWLAALMIFGFYPFGDRTILITDLSSQYVTFHAALLNMVRDGSHLFYTWDTGLGMNFLGLFAYYLSSPFTALLFLFPRAMITEGLLVVISTKMAACAAAFSFYLRRRWQIGGTLGAVFSTLYALSGFMVTYCYNLMWLDGVILLPLIILAARTLFEADVVWRKRKFFPLVILLTLLFISNFYIAYIVGIFTFLIYLLWMVRDRPARRMIPPLFGRFFGATILAVLLAAVLLLPTYCAIRSSYAAIHGASLDFSPISSPFFLLGKFAFDPYDSVTGYGAANVYGGVILFAAVPLWFLNQRFYSREKTILLLLLFGLSLCTSFYALDLFWHAFQPPTWFNYRYSFLFTFLALVLAVRTLRHCSGIERRWIPAVGIVITLLLILLYYWDLSQFAGNLWVTVALMAVYLLMIWLLTGRRLPLRLRAGAAAALLLIIPIELAANTVLTLDGLDQQLGFVSRDSFTAYSNQLTQLDRLLPEEDPDDFYRVESAVARDSNDGLDGAYHALSHYSSLSNQKTFRFLGQMGMVCYVNNRYLRYMGSTSALDAVLGIRYVWDTDEIRPGMIDTGKAWDDIRLYENTWALPLLYFADSAAADLPVHTEKPGVLDPLALQNRFFAALEGKEQARYFLPLSVEGRSPPTSVSTDEGPYSMARGAKVTITVHNPKRQRVLVYMSNSLPEFSAVYVDGVRLGTSRDRVVRGVMDLGVRDAGDIQLVIPVTGDSWRRDPVAYTLDEEAFAGLIDRLREHAPSSLTVTDTTVTGTVTAPRDGLLFTSIPQDPGWSVLVDGQPVEPVAVQDAFLAIPVTAGTHEVSLRFVPQGLVLGGILSGLGLLLALGIFWWFCRIRAKKGRAFPLHGSLYDQIDWMSHLPDHLRTPEDLDELHRLLGEEEAGEAGEDDPLGFAPVGEPGSLEDRGVEMPFGEPPERPSRTSSAPEAEDRTAMRTGEDGDRPGRPEKRNPHDADQPTRPPESPDGSEGTDSAD